AAALHLLAKRVRRDRRCVGRGRVRFHRPFHTLTTMATRSLDLVRPPRTPRAQRPPGDRLERNPGMPLDLDFVRAIRVNRSAVERRSATIPTRRTATKQW